MQIQQARFVTSVVRPGEAKLPPLPEIALVGRSNVGKSSLINTLVNQRGLARVGATPGKTRQVNYFCINEAFYLVDLPGYGYAKVSHAEKERWNVMIEGYLGRSQEEGRLKHMLLLLDIRHDPKPDDLQMAYWIQYFRVPCTIVATKGDEAPKSQRKLLADAFSDALQMTFRTPTIVFSAKDGTGREELVRRLGEALREPGKE